MKLFTTFLLLSITTLVLSQPTDSTYLDTIASINDDYRSIEVISLYDNTTLTSSIHRRNANSPTKNVDVFLNGNLIYQSINGIPLDSIQFDTTLVIDSGDTYKARCFNGGEAVVELKLSVSINTSVKVYEEETFNVYPNPVSSVLHFDLKSGNLFEIQLINMNGQLLKETTSQASFNWNIEDVKNGLYIIRLCQSGDCVQKKVIVMD